MTDNAQRETALRRIRELRDGRGRDSVTAALVAESTEYSSKQIGSTLSTLADEGHLEPWGGSTPQTYLIRLQEET